MKISERGKPSNASENGRERSGSNTSSRPSRPNSRRLEGEDSNKAISSRENTPARNGANQPEIIDLDDDDDVIIEEPPRKKQRDENSPIPEDPKTNTADRVRLNENPSIFILASTFSIP